MASFVEALLKERVWHWLDADREMEVDGEIDVGPGRIDLAAKSPEGKYIGVELKAGGASGWGTELFEQLHRYIESGCFDELYFASHDVDSVLEGLKNEAVDVNTVSQAARKMRAAIQSGHYSSSEAIARIDNNVPDRLLKMRISGKWGTVRGYIVDRLENREERKLQPASLDKAVSELRRAIAPKDVGVIHVPLNLANENGKWILRDLENTLNPAKAWEPIVRREATQLEKTSKPEFNRREEPWVRHHTWREFGGLPEAAIPNTRSSDQAHRPMDLLAFSDSYDPAEVLTSDEGDEIIGIEAKGESSFSSGRLTNQLSEFLETESFSRLYLAVPSSLKRSATDLIQTTDKLVGRVGIITVDSAGRLTVEAKAPKLELKHDGYQDDHRPRRLGYGDIHIKGEAPLTSLFLTQEERERSEVSDAIRYVRDLLTRESDLADESGQIVVSGHTELQDPVDDLLKSPAARAYLLAGYSADPYVSTDAPPFENVTEPKSGYVRLSLHEFWKDEEYGVKLHFGRGSWEGGYIWILGERVDGLIEILSTLDHLDGGVVSGQGKMIDLETFPFDYQDNMPHKLTGSNGSEKLLKLVIDADRSGDETTAQVRLGEKETQGVDVEMTRAQWCDLLACLDILKDGNRRQLPGEYRKYPRIGPSGVNTWNIGTDIEEQMDPKPVEEWQR